MEVSVSEVLVDADGISSFIVELDNSTGSGRLEPFEGGEYLLDIGVRCSSAPRALSIDEIVEDGERSSQGIVPGLIAGWNARSFQAVQAGDSILSVNGVRGLSTALKDELRAQKKLTVEVSCKNRRPAAGGSKVTKLTGLAESDTISTLKQKLAQERKGVSDRVLAGLQVLSFEGKMLEDEVQLSVLTAAGLGVGGKLLQLTDLAQLRSSTACSIPEVEHRGIRLEQLQDLTRFCRSRCRPDGILVDWQSVASGSGAVSGNPLRYDEMDFYQVKHWVLGPATKACSCSYVEVVASTAEAQVPCWLASHTWAEPLARVAACLECHSRTRAQPPSTAYWIEAFASGQSIDSSPSRSLQDLSFARALEGCTGTLLIFGEGPTPLDRLWCCAEEFVATTKMAGEVPLLLDVAATHQSGATVLTDGLAAVDGPGGSAWMCKSLREANFPTAILAEAALDVDLELAATDTDAERSNLLSAIAGAISDSGSSPRFAAQEAGQRLRASLAAVVWRRAVEEGDKLEDVRQRFGAALRASMQMHILRIDFGGCSNSFRDDHLYQLAESFPPSLRELYLNFYACLMVSDAGLSKLGSCLPKSLAVLKLDFWWCREITDWGVRSLAQGFPSNLKSLDVSFEECQYLGNEGVAWLAERLPPSLASLSLNFWNCTRIDDKGVSELAESLPSSLKKLSLTFCRVGDQMQGGASEITDQGLAKLAQAFPPGLLELSIHFVYCSSITDDGVKTLADSLPKGLAQLRLDFRGCRRISSEKQKLLESLELLRPPEATKLSTAPKEAPISKLVPQNGHATKPQSSVLSDNAKRVIAVFRKGDFNYSEGTMPRMHLLYLLQIMYPTLSTTQFDMLIQAAGLPLESYVSYEKFIGWLCSD